MDNMIEDFLSIIKKITGDSYPQAEDPELHTEFDTIFKACIEGVNRLEINKQASLEWYKVSWILYNDYLSRLKVFLSSEKGPVPKDDADLIVYIRCLALSWILMKSLERSFPDVDFTEKEDGS